jgi:mRNA interferase RelE/StbE
MDVTWQPKAIKQLKNIGSRVIQERILTASRGLSEFPACSNVKRLADHEPTFRLRVGNWRVLFNVIEEISIIRIEEVKKRDENTY